jgi:predicted alpha/beta-hydrolase family hydrolase
MKSAAQPLSIDLDGGDHVSGLSITPEAARACFVLAHGAGAGMTHPFLTAVADGLAERGIATLRYQFPYMERRSKRPDVPRVAQNTVRAAVAAAARLHPGRPLFAGGKSFGGRMTSQAQAEAPLPGVRGLIFLGFPLHPPGRPTAERGAHLEKIEVPLLFLQGTRDAFAEMPLLEPLVARLGARATLERIAEGDHSFHVPARSGRSADQVMGELLEAMVRWMDRLLRSPSRTTR